VATPTDRVLPAAQRADSDGAEDAEAEPEEPVKIMEMQGTFDDFVVWGHETLPAADDTFVKGVEEWLQFADAVCFYSPSIMVYQDTFLPWFFSDFLLDAYNPNISD
jgi:ribonuclease H2 subunit C